MKLECAIPRDMGVYTNGFVGSDIGSRPPLRVGENQRAFVQTAMTMAQISVVSNYLYEHNCRCKDYHGVNHKKWEDRQRQRAFTRYAKLYKQ